MQTNPWCCGRMIGETVEAASSGDMIRNTNDARMFTNLPLLIGHSTQDIVICVGDNDLM